MERHIFIYRLLSRSLVYVNCIAPASVPLFFWKASIAEDFPPLCFTAHSGLVDGELSLHTCCELWVLLLLLLPHHLRAAVAGELAGPSVSVDLVKIVRGPWALPLEALRETLAEMLASPQPQKCSTHGSRPALHQVK